MPNFLRKVADSLDRKDADRPRKLEGFTSEGAVVLTDFRGRREARFPEATTKSETLGSDPLAIYKPDGAKSIDAGRAMANFTGWTYAAINAIAREVSQIEFRLYQVKGKEHKELDDHPLLDLLDTVNDHMTGIELKYVTMAHLELTGNFFWYLDGVRNATDQPSAIYPLNPGNMRVKLNKGSFPYKLSHYEYTLDTKVYTFQPYQILHGKYPDPQDPYVGVSFVQSIPTWIDADNYAMEYNRKFFVRGAQVGLYIETDTNVEGNLDRIRKSWANRHEGVDNAHTTPVLPKGVKLQHTGVTQRDMDFAKLTDNTRDRILAAAGVSKTILGTAESDTNRSTAETADYVFSKRTIKPKVSLLVSYLNEFLVSRYGDDLYMTFIDPTPEDKEFRTKEMQAAAANLPIMTQNEVRQHYMGMGPIDGGDQLMVPNTMMPAGTSQTPEGEDMTPNLAKTAEGWKTPAIRVRTGGKTVHSAAARLRRELLGAFAKRLDSEPLFQVKALKDLTHVEYMEHWKRFDAHSMEAYQELVRIFQGINADQKAQVLENLANVLRTESGLKRSVKSSVRALADLFDPKEWIGITIDLATPILSRLAKDEATAALAMIGAKHQDILADEATRDALDRGISKMARSYNETTLGQLKEVLGDKLTQPGGTNLTELKEAVEGVYSYADERRAGLIAKTESFRAANWANREAWAQSGVVKTLTWYTAEDQRVCNQCAALDGKEVGIEDKFFTDTYSDGTVPPAHPDCRCYIRPEVVSIE